jgi:2-polyprenyl-3-methyl-5-hydroxy-6-metoxy-1,4-benzoquinol methylase
MLWIISGPSSVGKSTFLTSPRCSEITGLPAGTPVVWPRTSEFLVDYAKSDCFYHYNILRPFHLSSELRIKRKQKGIIRNLFGRVSGFGSLSRPIRTQSPCDVVTEFDLDPKWNDISERAIAKKVVVLVAGKQTILKRAGQRKIVEHQSLRNQEEKQYPTQYWTNLIYDMDLGAVYEAWCRELNEHRIPYILVDSTDNTYPILESCDSVQILVNSGSRKYTKEQIEKMLQGHKFEYHRVDLPWGLHTSGIDRSATRDLIFPESLKGKTVLDIGCGLGYFCFEAEARGATRIVGTELKEGRFRDAMLLKDIKDSKVEFLERDIIGDPLNEQFDYVLLLNVAHHLREPLRAIRLLASMTLERLIIEFPTFADRKFKKVVGIRFPSWYNRLPLIGVSSHTRAGQTFVFTPLAMKTILLDHERLFKKIDILDSPMPGRAIVICYKE